MTRTVNFNHANETPPPSVLLPSDHLKWIDGRGFDVNGNPAYIFPNDTAEQARLDLQHHLIVFTLGGHYVAPVGNRLEQGIKVLETGCGTGVWAMDMARKYPRSQFTGTDIISVFRDAAERAPANLRFELADTHAGLPFPDGCFDYVFQRLQVACFRKHEWTRIWDELVRVTKPGGYIELVDVDVSIGGGGPALAEFAGKIRSLLRMRNIEPEIVATFGRELEARGLVDVVQDHKTMLVGWGQNEIALAAAENLLAVFKSMKPQTTMALGLGDTEYDTMVDKAMAEISENMGLWKIQFTYGTKPAMRSHA
ncbi:S-adenosyl-L-methionine-dependent methyltransferase [Jimgerdemannia flammicorona]|uniref:S-adenosyl-L-methionine-dependent methyltransferase n=1 Tax=Jimgerdemannia flammicorona TaxID=994334 RepID=A0A433D9Q5_9FUNG|nr:S-adenosyl-L-methionine-dependent methyltransferase [Jimgerdemannia flammicorona]